eukprot:386552-Rhodomonas_salina.2
MMTTTFIKTAGICMMLASIAADSTSQWSRGHDLRPSPALRRSASAPALRAFCSSETPHASEISQISQKSHTWADEEFHEPIDVTTDESSTSVQDEPSMPRVRSDGGGFSWIPLKAPSESRRIEYYW